MKAMTPIYSGMSNQQISLTLRSPGERLDRAIAKELPNISRTYIQRLIEQGLVEINAQPVKAGQRLSGVEQVIITIPAVTESGLVAEDIALDIVYEDADILLIDKPAGMVVHPAPGHDQGTLVNAILAYAPKLVSVGGEKRPGIVHRLDRDTSGLILVAKHDKSLHYLQNQFRKREVAKTYLALVEGHFPQNKALIDAPIGRDPLDRKRMAVIPPGSSATARPAQTEVKVLNYYLLSSNTSIQAGGSFTLMECHPLTGRTHQIRVHLAFTGHPIAGDSIYGLRKQRINLDRHFLHAACLTFRRPSDGKELTVSSPLPAELQTVLDQMKFAD